MAIARLEDGRVLEANHALLFLIARDRDDVIGATIYGLGLFDALGDERARAMLQERGSIEGFDARIPMPSGETRMVRLWAEVIPDPDPIVVVRASDVDGRVAAGSRYHELRETEILYRTLVEQIPAICYTQVSDEDSPTGFRDTFISPQTRDLLGYTPEEWQADPELWVKTTHPEDRGRVLREDLTAATSGERFHSEYRMVAKDGAVRWFRDEAVLVEDPVTAVSCWQGVMLDITDERRAQEELEETTAKYRTLIEQIPAIVYLGEYGENGNWLYMSPQLERVLGYTPEEWLQHPHPMGSFVHPEDLPRMWAEERRALRAGDEMRAEYRIRARDGRWVWILDEAMPVLGEDGRPMFMQGVMYDVTEHKRTEEQLAGALERLQNLDRLKNTLLHTLSHDLKSPLTAILGAASTLERLDTELGEEERKNLLRTMVTRTMGMNTLLTDLLDLDRLDQGIVEPRRFPIDVGELVARLAENQDMMCGRPVELEVERAIVPIDAPKVERMVENLLVNAVRHTPAGSRVWVRVRHEGSGALIVVEDEGPGIPDGLKDRIFEAFQRGPTAEEVSGTGIGLSLVARFAELHGGRAWVEDRPGGGASFRVLLPSVPVGDPSSPAD